LPLFRHLPAQGASARLGRATLARWCWWPHCWAPAPALFFKQSRLAGPYRRLSGGAARKRHRWMSLALAAAGRRQTRSGPVGLARPAGPSLASVLVVGLQARCCGYAARALGIGPLAEVAQLQAPSGARPSGARSAQAGRRRLQLILGKACAKLDRV